MLELEEKYEVGYSQWFCLMSQKYRAEVRQVRRETEEKNMEEFMKDIAARKKAIDLDLDKVISHKYFVDFYRDKKLCIHNTKRFCPTKERCSQIDRNTTIMLVVLLDFW